MERTVTLVHQLIEDIYAVEDRTQGSQGRLKAHAEENPDVYLVALLLAIKHYLPRSTTLSSVMLRSHYESTLQQAHALIARHELQTKENADVVA